TGIEDAHLLREIDHAPDRPEVQAQGVDRAGLGFLVGPSLAHELAGARERGVDLDQEAQALVRRHGTPRLDSGNRRERCHLQCPANHPGHAAPLAHSPRPGTGSAALYTLVNRPVDTTSRISWPAQTLAARPAPPCHHAPAGEGRRWRAAAEEAPRGRGRRWA